MAERNSTVTKSGYIDVPGGLGVTDGTPYTPSTHRFFDRALPKRLVSFDEHPKWPTATFRLEDGRTCSMAFTDGRQLDDPALSKLRKADARKLRTHVLKACRYTYAAARSRAAGYKVNVSPALQPGPNVYAIDAEGDCLAPHFQDGDVLVCDPDQPPKDGDFVAIWWKGGIRRPSVKRLAMSVPEGDFEAAIICEQLKPSRTYSASMSSVDAIHKVLGKAASGRPQ